MTRDLVCGMNVDPAQAAANVEHRGETFYFCGKGCAKKFAADPDKYLQPKKPAPPTSLTLPILANVPQAKDPVCGMSVDPAKPAGSHLHEGKTYYFCSPRCAERFAKEPARFLAAPGTAGMELPLAVPPSAFQSEKKIRYTCPMDPEIIQFGPGVCPKCGMALEPMDIVAPNANDKPDPEYVSMRNRFWLSAALSTPLLILSIPE